jgi:5S rRNA maturation endonuclease (ribonuclease M5)
LGGNKFSQLSQHDKDKVRVWFEGEINDGAKIYNDPPKLRGERPPIKEVHHLWKSSSKLNQVNEDDEAIAFLKSRNLDMNALSKSGVVRITPNRSEYSWPSWWPSGRSQIWRVIVPAFDQEGKFVSVHGRAVRPPSAGPKTLWPKGFEAKGLFMPNRHAVKMIRGQAIDLDGLLFVEGLTDFLKCSAEVEDLKINLAILAGASGSFSAVNHLKIPKNIKIYVGTDPDEQGKEYANKIQLQLPGRTTYRIPLENLMGGTDD